MIMSLSQFNSSGDLMLSSMSGSLLLWKAKPDTSDVDEQDGSITSQRLADEEWVDFKIKKGKRSAQKKKWIGENLLSVQICVIFWYFTSSFSHIVYPYTSCVSDY